MASSDLLSQDEINALLQGVENGEVDTDTDSASEGMVQAFDFCRQDRIVSGNLPMLDTINERFARYFRRSLFDILRCNVEISATGVRVEKFSEYLHSQPVPTSFNLIKINPLPGKALCVMDPELVFLAVDGYFGGSGRLARIEGRDFSLTEIRVIHIILEKAFRDLKQAWKPLMPVEFTHQAMEADPHFANIARPAELAIVCGFQVDFAGGSGDLSIVMPNSMLKPISRLLNTSVQHDYHGPDEDWTVALREELRAAEVSLSCTLTQAELRLSELLSLKVGDILSINPPGNITIAAEDVPLFQGVYGVHKNRKAVKIQEVIKQSDSRTAHQADAAGVRT